MYCFYCITVQLLFLGSIWVVFFYSLSFATIPKVVLEKYREKTSGENVSDLSSYNLALIVTVWA